MKKTITLVLLLLLVVISAVFVGCDEHRLAERDELLPTCEADGHTKYYECTDIWCNYKEGYEVLPATGHDFETVAQKDATPYENGHNAYEECSACHTKRGYEEIFYVYPVCELLPAAEDRPLVSELSAEKKTELVGIYNAIMSFEETYALTCELTIADVELIMGYLNLLFPELIQCGEGYSYFYTEDTVTKVSFEYTMDKEEYANAMEALNEKVSYVVATTRDMTELQRETFVHDHIIDTCEYSIPAPHSGNAYGALVLGKAKCDGYSKAFSLLMMSLGTPCYAVSGVADEGPHAWNVVLVDGEYYKVDVTWDDCDAQYAYFNLDDEIFDRTHDADEKYEQVIPSCNSIALSVPYVSGTHVAKDEDVAQRLEEIVAAACEKENIDVHFRVETAEQFSYLEDNVNDLFTKYLSGKNQRFRFSTYTHDGAGYMRFVVDIINE